MIFASLEFRLLVHNMEDWEKTVTWVPSSSLVLCFKVSPCICPSQEGTSGQDIKSVITRKDGQETLGRDAGGVLVGMSPTLASYAPGAREVRITHLLLLLPTWQQTSSVEHPKRLHLPQP